MLASARSLVAYVTIEFTPHTCQYSYHIHMLLWCFHSSVFPLIFPIFGLARRAPPSNNGGRGLDAHALHGW